MSEQKRYALFVGGNVEEASKPGAHLKYTGSDVEEMYREAADSKHFPGRFVIREITLGKIVAKAGELCPTCGTPKSERGAS